MEFSITQINFVLIAFVLILAFLIVRGLRRGVIGMIMGVAAWIFVIGFTSWLYPQIQNLLLENQGLIERVQTSADKQVIRKEEDTGITEWLNTITSTTEAKGDELKEKGMLLPTFMQEKYDELIEEGVNLTAEVTGTTQEIVHDALVSTYTEFILKGIAVIATIVVAALIVFILRNIIRLIGKLPIIHGVSHLLGGALGAVEGFLVLWLILYLAAVFSGSVLGGYIFNQAYQSELIVQFNRWNIFAFLFG